MLGALLEKMLTDGVHMFDDDGKISVIAEFLAKAGHEEEVRVILHEIVAPSRAEAGCDVYHLMEDKKSLEVFRLTKSGIGSRLWKSILRGQERRRRWGRRSQCWMAR